MGSNAELGSSLRIAWYARLMSVLASSAPTMPVTVETSFHICLRRKVSGTCRVFTLRTYPRNIPGRPRSPTAHVSARDLPICARNASGRLDNSSSVRVGLLGWMRFLRAL